MGKKTKRAPLWESVYRRIDDHSAEQMVFLETVAKEAPVVLQGLNQDALAPMLTLCTPHPDMNAFLGKPYSPEMNKTFKYEESLVEGAGFIVVMSLMHEKLRRQHKTLGSEETGREAIGIYKEMVAKVINSGFVTDQWGTSAATRMLEVIDPYKWENAVSPQLQIFSAGVNDLAAQDRSPRFRQRNTLLLATALLLWGRLRT